MYPWLEKQKQQIVDAKKKNRLGHAYLFSGVAGLGKEFLAKELAYWLLCLEPTADAACGRCHACHLFQADTHPDFYQLGLEEESSQIKVDQVRDLTNFCVQTSQISFYQVVIINQAEKMNISAANALLKTLEEPAGNTVIFLITNQWSRLPMTIKSRCQQVLFYSPEKTVASEWLQQQGPDKKQAELLINLSSGAPLAAKKLFTEDFLTKRQQLFSDWVNWQIGKLTVSQFIKNESSLSILELLSQLQSWYADAFKIQQGVSITQIANLDLVDTLTKLVTKVFKKSLLPAYQQIEKTHLEMLASPNLNSELVLTDLLMKLKVYS